MCCEENFRRRDRGRPSLPDKLTAESLARTGRLLRRALAPVAGVDAAGQAERIVGLDILRGLGTCVVIMAHILLATPGNLLFQADGLTWRTVYVGNCMLECFFALSGFLIGGALLHYEKFDRARVFNYAVDRSTRILPAYYAVFALLTAFNYLVNNTTKIHYSYLLFMQCWLDDMYFIGVAWTLCIEAFSYLLLPIIIWICRFKLPAGKNGYAAIIAVCIAIILVESLLRFSAALHAQDIHMDDALRKQAHLRLDALLYGLIVACLKQTSPAVYRRLACPAVFFASVCGMLALVEWQYADLFIRNIPGERHKPFHALLDFSLSGVLAASLIPFCEAVRPARLHWTADRLCAFLQYVAKISYSLYLVHLLLLPAFMLFYTKIATQNILMNHIAFCIVVVFYLLACFLLADAMFARIERPAMQLRKKIRMKRHD